MTGLDVIRLPTLTDQEMWPGFREQTYYWRQIGRLDAIENQWMKGAWPRSLALIVEHRSLVRELWVLAPAESERRAARQWGEIWHRD